MRQFEYRKALAAFTALFLGLLCAGCPVPQITTWYRFLGTDADDAAYAIEKTSDGGYILAGMSEATAETSDNAHLTKLSAFGLVEWEADFGDERDDMATCVAQTSDGGYIVAGQFGDENAEVTDAFLLKTDADGTEKWRKLFDSGGHDAALSVTQTADGGYLLGVALDTLNTADATMIKTDVSGAELWRVTAPENTHAVTAIQTQDGGCLLAWWRLVPTAKAGAFSGEIGLIKTDAIGNNMWEASLTDDEAIQLEDMRETADGGLILVGQIDFLGNDSQLFLWKTDADGVSDWRTTYGDTGRNIGYCVRETSHGGFIVAGATHPVGEQTEALLLYANEDGLTRWLRHYGGNDREVAHGVVAATAGGFVLAGLTESTEPEDQIEHTEILVVKTDMFGHAPGIERDE